MVELAKSQDLRRKQEENTRKNRFHDSPSGNLTPQYSPVKFKADNVDNDVLNYFRSKEREDKKKVQKQKIDTVQQQESLRAFLQSQILEKKRRIQNTNDENEIAAKIEMERIAVREEKQKKLAADHKVLEKQNLNFVASQIKEHKTSQKQNGSPVLTKVGPIGMTQAEIGMNSDLL